MYFKKSQNLLFEKLLNKILTPITMFILLPLMFFTMPYICIALYVLLLLNRKYYKLYLKSIIKEASLFYNVNIINDDFLTFHKKDKFTSIPMPGKLTELKNVAEKFKDKVGCIDCQEFMSNRKKFSIITTIKKDKNNLFFYPLSKDKKFLSEIHLYDLSSLDEYEFQSILSMNLTKYQKAVIYKKFIEKYA